MWLIHTALIANMPVAKCPQQSAPAKVAAHLETLKNAFADTDISGVRSAHNKATESLKCLNGPLPPETVKDYFLFTGIIAWLDNNKQIFKSHAIWLKTIDKTAAIDTQLFPASHVIHTEFAAVSSGKYTRAPREPIEGQIVIDGIIRGKRIANAPAIVQIQDKDGSWETRLLDSSAKLPPYPTLSLKKQALWTSAGITTIGIGLFATAFKFKSDYETVTMGGIKASERETLTSAFAQNQTFGIAAYTVTGLGIALGTWAVLQE